MDKINFLLMGTKSSSKKIITDTFSKTPVATETVNDVNISIYEDDQIKVKVFDIEKAGVCYYILF